MRSPQTLGGSDTVACKTEAATLQQLKHIGLGSSGRAVALHDESALLRSRKLFRARPSN